MHLAGLSVDVLDRKLMRTLSEGALWVAVRAEGLMRDTVVIRDDAGQFPVADHALCWAHLWMPPLLQGLGRRFRRKSAAAVIYPACHGAPT